ncbi:MAG: Mth938-like domain-containing protein [Chromatiales bacterium]|jgi:uncharacterized protein
MKFALDDIPGQRLVTGYGPGRIRVGRVEYTRSLAVSPDRIIPDWGPDRAGDLTGGHFDALMTLLPEILILGTGPRQAFPDPAIYSRVLERQVGFEVMDTAAACRTYNILLGEGRRVVAALIMI